MLTRISIRHVLTVLLALLLLWWFWPTEVEEFDAAKNSAPSKAKDLVSAIQPIDNADALIPTDEQSASNELIELDSQPANLQASEEEAKEFRRAINALQIGDDDKAAEILQQLIDSQPGLLEPYINLASIQAAQGNLNKARETLMKGLTANQNYAVLFGSLQKVHGALASNAYQLALASSDANRQVTDNSIALPVTTQLTAKVNPDELLNQQVAAQEASKLKSQLARQNDQLSNTQELLDRTKNQLTQISEQLKVAQSSAQLNQDLSEDSVSKINALEARLSAAQSELVQLQKSHQTEISGLRAELDQQKTLLANQQLAVNENQSRERAAAEQARIAAEALAAQRKRAEQQAALDAVAQENAAAEQIASRDENIIKHVKSWADAWSRQDVADYIDHYQDGYSPDGISNRTWREQRQVRLTNKQFIEVTLSNFDTQSVGDQVRVRFTQRYRSNTMDDTIRKQLTLKTSGNDWSKAKIVSEKVLR
jgi:hypothetical protein